MNWGCPSAARIGYNPVRGRGAGNLGRAEPHLLMPDSSAHAAEARWRALVSGTAPEWWAPAARGGLSALSALYGAGVRAYRAGYDLGLLRAARLPCTVISVGNLTVGGTGKTTTVRWLVRRLLEWDARPAILSYGYRAGSEGDGSRVRVVSGPEGVRLPVEESGDEPQLLARSLPGVPVLAGRRRLRSGRAAREAFGVDVCVLDDGFQYWKLARDLDLVLINALNPFGYGHLLPRGGLREPLSALRRADAVLITHADALDPAARSRLRAELARRHPGLVVGEARHIPVRLREHEGGAEHPRAELTAGRWLALSSLGEPESFARSLRALGARELVPAPFPDHHAYTRPEIELLAARVRREGLAGIVTTEKDAVKIPAAWLGGTVCRVLEIDLELLDGREALEALVRMRLRARERMGPSPEQ